jgi:hypothetical protein
MSQDQAPTTVAEKGTKVTDYLEQPRSKKREHIILALGDAIEPEMKLSIHRMLKDRFKNQALVTPKDIKETLRNIGKKISYLIVDDSFAEWSVLESMVSKLKETNSDTGVPTFFLTKNARQLIESYHHELSIYQELDDYIDYTALDRRQTLLRIDQLLKRSGRRRSRRFAVNIPVFFTSLDESKKFAGELIDISMHGAVLRIDDEQTFKANSQMLISMQISKILPPEFGEVMTLSALVRRIRIGGNTAGVSWEHLSENKCKSLIQIVTFFAREDAKIRLRAHLAASKKNADHS